MSFMDKLKGAVQVVTGGAAKVTIEYEPKAVVPGDRVQVRITAASTGGEVKCSGAYVDLVADEEVHVPRPIGDQERGDVSATTRSFSCQIQLAQEFTLAPNATRRFEGVVEIPANAWPTYEGRYAKHTWGIRGRIATFGNDPDSGYQPLRVALRV